MCSNGVKPKAMIGVREKVIMDLLRTDVRFGASHQHQVNCVTISFSDNALSILQYRVQLLHSKVPFPHWPIGMSLMTALLLLIILVLPLALLYLVYLPPPWLIHALSSRYPGILFHISTVKPILALTIDDAPSGTSTAAILEVLRANDTHATFFVIGSYAEGREAVLRDLLLYGNELANHAMHDEPSWKLGTVELTEQLMQTQRKIQSIYRSSFNQSNVSISTPASPPQYFRPGSGFFTSSMLMLLDNLSYRLILGSIYPHDAQISLPWLNAWHILRGARPGGILVCHDRLWTPEMLRRVLPELRRRGFRVGSLSEALSWAEGGLE